MKPIFHAHVYFESEGISSAQKLRDRVALELKNLILGVSRLVTHPIGPHPLPMFEIDFEEASLGEVYTWLRSEHGQHSVLIHKDAEPETIEHTLHATWIGAVLPLKLEALDIGSRVHQHVMGNNSAPKK